MHFDGDAFISYAHLDNQELVEGRKGWVANLHRALEIRVGQLLGKEPHIWRDPKLQGNDVFAATLIERLNRVAVLIAIVSPRYVKSEWARRELSEFWKAAEQQGGVHLNQKARIFKILKTPVPVSSHPPELQATLGYEFFKIDSDTGRIRELDEVFGPEAQRDFWIKLDDVAHEVCALIEKLEGSSLEGAPALPQDERLTIFLAETTSDLKEQRETLRRDLQQQGYEVLPDQPLPHVASELESVIRRDLARCRLSIHLFGQHFGVVPEGRTDSLAELQNELALEHARGGGFFRLLWIPPGLTVTDARQRLVLDRLRDDPRLEEGADLLETFLEDFRTLIQTRLEGARSPAVPPAAAAHGHPGSAEGRARGRVYLIHDARDAGLVAPWADVLFSQGVEVLHPVFEGDEAEVREDHEENLKDCDGVLLFYGAGGEVWLRRKLRELQKAAGYGRTGPPPAIAIAVLPPVTPDKARFRTHEAVVLPPVDIVSAQTLAPLTARLRAGGEGERG